jgi:hypothetical protein
MRDSASRQKPMIKMPRKLVKLEQRHDRDLEDEIRLSSANPMLRSRISAESIASS